MECNRLFLLLFFVNKRYICCEQQWSEFVLESCAQHGEEEKKIVNQQWEIYGHEWRYEDWNSEMNTMELGFVITSAKFARRYLHFASLWNRWQSAVTHSNIDSHVSLYTWTFCTKEMYPNLLFLMLFQV